MTTFLSNSAALKYHEENWVPICLPNFNSNAFLQAYISHINLKRGSDFDSGSDVKSGSAPESKREEIALCLLSANHEDFSKMHNSKTANGHAIPNSYSQRMVFAMYFNWNLFLALKITISPLFGSDPNILPENKFGENGNE